MYFFSSLTKIVRRLNFFLCLFGMCFVLILMFITVTDVIGRSFFARPLPGAFELSEYMLSIVILMGLAYTQQMKGHIRVNVFLKKSEKRRIFEIVSIILSLFVATIIVIYGLKEMASEKAVSDMLRIPKSPFKFFVPFAGFLLCLELFMDLLSELRKDHS